MNKDPDDWNGLKREVRLFFTALFITLARLAVPKDLACVQVQSGLALASLAVTEVR